MVSIAAAAGRGDVFVKFEGGLACVKASGGKRLEEGAKKIRSIFKPTLENPWAAVVVHISSSTTNDDDEWSGEEQMTRP